MSKNKSTKRTKSAHNPKSTNPNAPIITSFKDAHGRIPYNMTNDYMFRAVLQSNNKVLRGLICALLNLQESDVRSVEITNTAVLGDAIEDKEYHLDVNVILNDDRFINLEMQVANELDWPNRSVMYLCRSLDQLNHGQSYNEIKPVIQIGFLNYTLFKEYPEFYATYKLLNVNNHQIYNDNMTLCVVDLSKIDLATEADREQHIDRWAALFKAKTWEELKMIAGKSEYMTEASQTIFRMSADERVRKMCQDREDYYNDIRYFNKVIAETKSALVEKDNALAEKEGVIAEQETALLEKDNIITQLKAEIESLKNQH